MSNFFDDFTKPLPVGQRMLEAAALALTVLNVLTVVRHLDSPERWALLGVSVFCFLLITLFAYKPQWNSKTTNHNARQMAIDACCYRVVGVEMQALLLTSVRLNDCGEHEFGVPFYIVIGLLLVTALVYEVLIIKNRTKNE